MYERQQYVLDQISHGYQTITRRYPQPNKFGYRNSIIAQTIDMDEKLALVKDLTRELTQMTTVRLLNFFNLIPEFHSFTQQEKTFILTKNMLPVFMFHGALTYNPDQDTFVDRLTGKVFASIECSEKKRIVSSLLVDDQPYDAKYLLFVYGHRVYNDLIAVARQMTEVTYQYSNEKHSDEHSHTLFLLLMAILLFSSDFQCHSIEQQQTNVSKLKEKISTIQQNYVDLACRFIHDQFGFTVGKRMFQKLVPLLRGKSEAELSKHVRHFFLLDLQKLCSTLANVNLCEMAEDEDRNSASRAAIAAAATTAAPTTVATTNHRPNPPSVSSTSSSGFNSTMISGTSHLNELQKENRAPPPPTVISSPNSLPLPSALRSSPSVLSNASPSPPVAMTSAITPYHYWVYTLPWTLDSLICFTSFFSPSVDSVRWLTSRVFVSFPSSIWTGVSVSCKWCSLPRATHAY